MNPKQKMDKKLTHQKIKMDKSGYNSSQGASKVTKFGYDVKKHQIRSYSTLLCFVNKTG